jgi:hypothetical protein
LAYRQSWLERRPFVLGDERLAAIGHDDPGLAFDAPGVLRLASLPNKRTPPEMSGGVGRGC